MKAHRSGRFGAAAAWFLGVTLGVAAPVAATTFSYQVDRFEMDGNVRGPFDGTADVVDEFDDGSTSPGWYRAYGTVAEHDGFMFLTDPGSVFPDPTGRPLELSIAASGAPYAQDGSGNFTGVAYWLPLLPPAGHHYHFSIYTFSGTPYFNEIVGLGFLGLGDGNYAIEQHLTELNLGAGIYQNLISVQHPIDASQITGNLGMRLAFDDATNLVTTSFSLDGGATWESPFAPAPIFNGRSMAQFILSADPVFDGTSTPTTTVTTTTVITTTSTSTTTTTFPPGPCDPTGCRRGFAWHKSVLVMRPSAQKLVWKWSKGAATTTGEFGSPLASTAYDLCVADGAGNLVYTAVVPPGASWTQSGQAFRYRTAGSVRSVVLRGGVDGRASIAFTVKGLPPGTPFPPFALPMTARLRSSDGRCWATVNPGVVVNRSDYVKVTGE